jgi:hypothetical protein
VHVVFVLHSSDCQIWFRTAFVDAKCASAGEKSANGSGPPSIGLPSTQISYGQDGSNRAKTKELLEC